MEEYAALIKRYGEHNVEEAMIFLRQQCDPRGLPVYIKATPKLVKRLLAPIHGRYEAKWL